MQSRDRAWLGAGIVLTVLLSGTCWYAAARGKISWRDHHGEVVGRHQVLPTLKRTVPVAYEITIREPSGELFSFYVPREDYQRAKIGAYLHRDRFGKIVQMEVKGNTTK